LCVGVSVWGGGVGAGRLGVGFVVCRGVWSFVRIAVRGGGPLVVWGVCGGVGCVCLGLGGFGGAPGGGVAWGGRGVWGGCGVWVLLVCGGGWGGVGGGPGGRVGVCCWGGGVVLGGVGRVVGVAFLFAVFRGVRGVIVRVRVGLVVWGLLVGSCVGSSCWVVCVSPVGGARCWSRAVAAGPGWAVRCLVLLVGGLGLALGRVSVRGVLGVGAGVVGGVLGGARCRGVQQRVLFGSGASGTW